MRVHSDPNGGRMLWNRKERHYRKFMSSQEYATKAIELASKCKFFAEKTCKEWREETALDSTDWEGLREMREIYLSLQILRHSAEVVLQRARLIKSSRMNKSQSMFKNGQPACSDQRARDDP
jgi:hypothetical protein